jgi:acetolactate synthase-1/2/3 large subunit
VSEISAGAAVVRVLESAGVDVVFGVLSVHNLPLYQAIDRRGRVRPVAARTENGAVGMADGYARASGRLGVAITSTGVGAANGAGALLEAYTASSAVLHLTGQVDSAAVEQDRGALHGAKDQLGMLRSVGKGAERVPRADEAALVVADAIRVAQSGRPGPVSVEIPIDLQYARVPATAVEVQWPVPAAPEPEPLRAAATLLGAARRPLIWAGGGVRLSGAAGALRSLAERLGAGVITTQAGRGALAEDHPLCVGNFSLDPSVAELLADSDLLLAVGTRFRGNETRGWQLPLPRPLVRVDVDPTLVCQNYSPDVALVGDALLTLEKVLSELPEGTPEPGWTERVASAGRAARQHWRAMLGTHEALLDGLQAALPRGAVVVRDVTVPATVWGSRLLKVLEPRDALHSASMAIGQGLPMAIGAAVGRPDRRIVLLVGDGGFAVALGEFPTAVQECLPLVVVLFNDEGYGILRNLQDAHFGGQRFGVDLGAPNFARIAEAMGGWGCQVASLADFSPALREALAQDGPALVEVDLRKIGPMAVPFTGAARLVP